MSHLPLPTLRRGPLLSVLTLILLLAGLVSAQAQLRVRASVPHKLYLAGEAVKVDITITNLTGREVLLRSNPTAPWLGFSVKTTAGENLPMKTHGAWMPDLTMQPGETLNRSIPISRSFPLQQAGDYVVRAWVYFADMRDYLYSGDSRFTVAPGRVVWKETVGVPLEEQDGGSYRTYEVQTLKEIDRIRIYAVVKGRANGQVLQCYLMGNVLQTVNPQATIDGSNQLHVLYMGSPQVLNHVIMRYDGFLVASDNYRVTDKYPRLVRAETGEVGVIGGVKLTPATLPTDPNTGQAMAPPMLSDRPE